jgi:phage/plasmid-associated DNA primase
MGLLGDSGETGENVENDQEMQELQENPSQASEEMASAAEGNPATHKNIHVVSASDGEGSDDRRDSAAPDGDGSGQPETGTATNTMGGEKPQEKTLLLSILREGRPRARTRAAPLLPLVPDPD